MPPATSARRQTSAAAWLAVGALGAATVAGPLWLGGVPAWSRFAIEAAMAVAVIAWLWRGPASRWLVIVPLGVAAAAWLQVVPCPVGLLARLAPLSAARWAVADAGLHGSWRPVSVDPAATAAAVRRLLLVLATAAVVADVSRAAACRRFLAAAVGFAAVAILAAGWVFPVRDRVMLGGLVDLKGPIDYWLTPLEPTRATAGFGYPRWIDAGSHRYLTVDAAAADGFGCYLNSNHFAGALCITLPAALGLWLWLTQGRLPGAVRHAVTVSAIFLAAWTAGGMAHSRAGAAAILFGGLVFLSLVAERRWVRRGTAVVVAAAIVGLVAFLVVFLGGFTDAVGWLPEAWQPKVAALLRDPRIAASAAALRIFRVSPFVGTGLDTYGEVSRTITANAGRLFFAHNDYAQALAETGLVGAGIAAAIGLVLARGLRGFLWQPASPMRPIDAGSWAALAGIAVHSCFDWNLHVPANALLASVNAGIALGGAAAQTPPQAAAPPRGGVWRRVPAILLGLACVVATAFLFRDACSERAQRRLSVAIAACRPAPQDRGVRAHAAALAAAVETGERMARFDPANARLAVLLGQACLHAAALDSGSGGPSPRVEEALGWFSRARRHAATCVDLCEPLPAKPVNVSGTARGYRTVFARP
jgi:O-antigen ligase